LTKTRVSIPSDVAADVMFASDSTCCKCNGRGKSVQIHHIDEDPRHNEPDNLAVLCLQCHDETQVGGGFGRRLNAPLVIKYRDAWIARVAQRRAEADRLAVAQVIGSVEQPVASEVVRPRPVRIVDDLAELEEHANAVRLYVESLPRRRKELRERVEEKLDGSTADAAEGTYEYIDLLQGLLVTLARFYPPGTFGDDPHRFFAESIANVFRWHRAIAEPLGPGTGGTIVGRWIGGGVMSDVENMVVDIAMSLIGYDDQFDHERWRAAWDAA
jgi:hypothetical protein